MAWFGDWFGQFFGQFFGDEGGSVSISAPVFTVTISQIAPSVSTESGAQTGGRAGVRIGWGAKVQAELLRVRISSDAPTVEARAHSIESVESARLQAVVLDPVVETTQNQAVPVGLVSAKAQALAVSVQTEVFDTVAVNPVSARVRVFSPDVFVENKRRAKTKKQREEEFILLLAAAFLD
jgi:hypothetical protein